MGLLENQKAAETVDILYQNLECQLMQNIARHLKDWEQPIDTDKWLLQKMAELGSLNKENIRIIAKMSGLSQTAAERMLNEVAEEAIKNIDPGLKSLCKDGLIGKAVEAKKSKNVKQVVHNMRSQAKDTLNMCNTTMLYKARDAYSSLVQKIAIGAKEIENKQDFIEILNKHGEAVTAGVESRHQSMRKCIREFNEKGIPAFVDKRGRKWTPEAYVNMAMRNTARQTAEEVQTARCKDAGVNLIQIDSHSGARPRCAKDQGKIFSLDNTSGETEDLYGKKIKYYPWSSSSYGKPDGILGINCRHHKWPFIPGVNIQRYFPTEDVKENSRIYKDTQTQRALERDVRSQKRECMLYDEIGDTEAFENASVKLKEKEERLKQYVNGHGDLHRRRDREQVVGFDKRISAETVAADKKVQKKTLSLNKDSGQVRNKNAMTDSEKKEFEILKSKYKSTEEAILFGSNEEMERYVQLQKKAAANIDKEDMKSKFESQSISDSTLNSWKRNPSKEEYDAISSYSRSGYVLMNSYLRSGGRLSDTVKKEINALETYLESNIIKSDIYLKRGTNNIAMNNLLGDGWKNNLSGQVGKRIVEKGFCSASPYKDGGFGGDVVMYIKAPSGTKGAYIKDYCANESEKEFLLQRNTEFEIKKIDEIKDKWGESKYIVHAEVVVNE